MRQAPDPDKVAAALMVGVGLLIRQVRLASTPGELTMPETSALARLDRGGPTTASELAKHEQISPQSMGATLKELEDRGLVERRPDPGDGRRAVISPTEAGLQLLRNRRTARTERVAQALATGFTPSELEQLMAAAPLIERLGQCV
jgi:DNA-binding MarR family transcriptional regulator